ncbi:MAG: HU family DNA-binding protein [Betaproteobacteria bacterium]
MNSPDLITKLGHRLQEIPIKDIEVSAKLILGAITQALAKGHRAEIRGFGSFSLNYHPPRTGRNSGSGEEVHVPAKHHPHFKPGKDLKLRVEAAADCSINRAPPRNLKTAF